MTNPRILLTGKDGQLGFELQRSLAPLGDLVAVGREDCDLANPNEIRQLIWNVAPAVIVNAAAYTAVDQAELEPAIAHAINGTAPGVLGEEASLIGALVVHYSTDYVFDGTKNGAYTEDDPPNPQSIYGRSKLAGEKALLASGANCLIFRTSWVFGAHGSNFAKTILRLAAEREVLRVVSDQYGAPTSAALLADVSAQIISLYKVAGREGRAHFPYGLYHLAAGGVTNWHAYAQAVVRAAQSAGRPLCIQPEAIVPVPSSAYPLPAPRPANSRLDSRRLKTSFGLRLPPWGDGLRHVLAQLL